MSTATAIMNIDLKNMKLPVEGPRCVPVDCDFAVNSAFTIDGSQLVSSGRMSLVQGVYIDNRDGAFPIVMSLGISGQQIACPEYCQGYFPILAPSPFTMVVTSANAVFKRFYFYNVPLPAQVWSFGGGFEFDSNGNLLVSDPALEALIDAQQLRVKLVTDIADIDVSRFSVNTTASQTLIDSNPNFFCDFLRVALTPDAAVAVAGMVSWEIRDGATVKFSGSVYIPAASGAAGALPLGDIILLNLSDMGWKSITGNDLFFVAGTALTAGRFNVSCGGVAYG